MSKFLYKQTLNSIGTGNLDLSSLSNVKAILIESGIYTPDEENHDFLDDIPAGARLATQAVSNYDFGTTDLSAAYIDAITFTTPTSGKTIQGVVYYEDTGVESTSNLLLYDDEQFGIPLITDGNDVIVTFTDALFRLG